MLKSKKIITILAIMFLLVTLFVQVKATEDNPLDLPILSSNTTLTSGTETNSMYANAEAANAIKANQIAANKIAANSQVLQPSTTTNNLSGNKLPQTGVTEDITVMFFIIVCVISAVYAYKKIRDYNI